MHIKTTMRYHLTSVKMTILKSLQTISAVEGLQKREDFHTVGENVYWYVRIWMFLKLKLELTYDPAILLLSTYPERSTI